MLFKQVACICALLLVYSQLGKGHDFDRCSVGHQESEKMWVSMNLSDFENHNPKKTEIIRTKAYVKGKFPAFRVKNNESEVHFGKTRDNVWRIMYLSDDSLQEDPCFLKLEEITFLENTFNEVHFILKSKLFLRFFLNYNFWNFRKRRIFCNCGERSRVSCIFMSYSTQHFWFKTTYRSRICLRRWQEIIFVWLLIDKIWIKLVLEWLWNWI